MTSDDGSTDTKNGKKTKQSARKKKKMMMIILLLVLVAIAAVFLFWGMTPNPYYKVNQIVNSPQKFINSSAIEIKGNVRDWNGSYFNLTEGDHAILVEYTQPFPQNFGEGKDIVVKGQVVSFGGILMIKAEKITVGCPSKYG